MPIYEYQCQACGIRHEALQKMSDDPLTDCPECGEPKLKKLVSAAAFRLKGGGWYETDFKSGQKKNLVEGEGGKKSTDGASTKSADSKSGAGDTKSSTKGDKTSKSSAKSSGSDS